MSINTVDNLKCDQRLHNEEVATKHRLLENVKAEYAGILSNEKKNLPPSCEPICGGPPKQGKDECSKDHSGVENILLLRNVSSLPPSCYSDDYCKYGKDK